MLIDSSSSRYEKTKMNFIHEDNMIMIFVSISKNESSKYYCTRMIKTKDNFVIMKITHAYTDDISFCTKSPS